jgi:branched-chain amino acid transport system ATP-binding protein
VTTADQPTGALTITGLSVDRGDREVLHGVDLTALPGTVTALLGPNGAGKSSLVLTIAGVLHPTRGRVLVDDVDVTGHTPDAVRAAGLATVPEGHRVLGDLSVADNLRTAALLVERSGRAAAVERVLSLFDELRDLTDRRAGSLSGGQQQMVAIAQALVSQPKYLVIDEMSLGLAPVVVRRLVPALDRIAAAGVGVLLIEQFTAVALGISSQTYAMSQGRVVFSAPASELREDPRLLEQAYRLA